MAVQEISTRVVAANVEQLDSRIKAGQKASPLQNSNDQKTTHPPEFDVVATPSQDNNPVINQVDTTYDLHGRLHIRHNVCQ